MTKAFAAATIGVILSGCGAFSKDDNSSNDGGNDSGFSQPANSGCVQGVVLDGLTGKRIALATSNEAGEPRGVSVLVHNQLIQAAPMLASGDGGSANLLGEYSLCGFPLDESFPIFAWVDGYESFEGLVSVDSTVAQRTPQSRQADILRSNPTMLANIKLYPKGTQTQDLKFVISHDGEKVSGAQVQLRATGANVLDATGALAPQVRLVPQTTSTSSSGEVVFPAAALVLGGIYEYTVLPPDGGEELALAKGTVSVGLLSAGTALTASPYEVKVTLAASRVETPEAVPTPTPVPDDGDDEEDPQLVGPT